MGKRSSVWVFRQVIAFREVGGLHHRYARKRAALKEGRRLRNAQMSFRHPQFNPKDYPGDDPFFADNKKRAEEYRFNYQNGRLEFRIPTDVFDGLRNAGIVKGDPRLSDSFHVPEAGLPAFNAAIQLGPENTYLSENEAY